MKSSKNLMTVVALFALSTFSFIMPSAYRTSIATLSKIDANEEDSNFTDRLVNANINSIKQNFFDEYPDAIVFNIAKSRKNKAFLKSLMLNITREFPDKDRDKLAVFLANAIGKNVKNDKQSLEKYDQIKILQLID